MSDGCWVCVCRKITEYEEELNMLASNLKSVEVNLEQANERESEYETTIKDLDERLEEALKRAEFAERTINKLEQQVNILGICAICNHSTFSTPSPCTVYVYVQQVIPCTLSTQPLCPSATTNPFIRSMTP